MKLEYRTNRIRETNLHNEVRWISLMKCSSVLYSVISWWGWMENRVIASWTVKMTMQFIFFIYFFRNFVYKGMFPACDIEKNCTILFKIYWNNTKDGSTTSPMLSILQEQALCKLLNRKERRFDRCMSFSSQNLVFAVVYPIQKFEFSIWDVNEHVLMNFHSVFISFPTNTNNYPVKHSKLDVSVLTNT